ncbi:acyl carrier protein [Isoptericola sp. b441]|uniref:Acyl carrier protein n=1 Tax=Actinotalea lenta TaxID=3064654 RepID=A0ABT9DA85_9CELL|nr:MULTISPECIES: acyl carrier protein [unclassified Isoptericola]MDO8107048.1 acyl carrier protein [Isoptericola sp. b441]MDO8121242.1 acyl carrier protein [Isoptericola sp. b490]
MDDTELRTTVLKVLGQVAPEVDLERVEPSEDLREQFDLDSMDILDLAIGLYQETGIEVPEQDYAQVVTVDGAVAYLTAHALH